MAPQAREQNTTVFFTARSRPSCPQVCASFRIRKVLRQHLSQVSPFNSRTTWKKTDQALRSCKRMFNNCRVRHEFAKWVRCGYMSLRFFRNGCVYQVIHANMLIVPFCIPMHVYQPATAGRFSEQQFFNQVTAWCQTHVSFMKFEEGYVKYIYIIYYIYIYYIYYIYYILYI